MTERVWRSLRIPRETNSGRGWRGSARSCLPTGVDDVDVAEACDRAAVTHRVHLHRLTLCVAERTAELIALWTTNQVEARPELGRLHLIGDVLQHTNDLAALDLI